MNITLKIWHLFYYIYSFRLVSWAWSNSSRLLDRHLKLHIYIYIPTHELQVLFANCTFIPIIIMIYELEVVRSHAARIYGMRPGSTCHFNSFLFLSLIAHAAFPIFCHCFSHRRLRTTIYGIYYDFWDRSEPNTYILTTTIYIYL